MLVLYVPLGLIFQISAPAAALYGFMFQFFAFFPHMNLRIELGPLTPFVMGPQVHRIHHSIYREHFDTNFAGAFPLWDVVFGTYHAPSHGEFPSTGIPSLPGKPTVGQAVTWPLWSRRTAAQLPNVESATISVVETERTAG
jgi:sterol desaturase/sphingolipid hydroxylase (fatty acid hydroxylase superfamily)